MTGPAFSTRLVTNAGCAGVQLIISPNAVLNAPKPALRNTNAYCNVLPPTFVSSPLGARHLLAKFVWTEFPGGTKDLDVYSPPNSSTPIFSIRGLYGLTFPSIPVDFDTLPSIGFYCRFAQSTVDSFEPLNITGHVLGEGRFKGLTSIATYYSLSYAPPLNLDGGFYNVGNYFFNSTARLTAQLY